MKNNKLKEFKKAFSEVGLWSKLKNHATKAGHQTVYTVLLLFYAYKRKDTPLWAKNVIIGAMGYFISPIDALPDLTPFLGYTDDIGVLSFGLVTIACYVNDEVKTKAREQLKKWFTKYNEADLKTIDDKL